MLFTLKCLKFCFIFGLIDGQRQSDEYNHKKAHFRKLTEDDERIVGGVKVDLRIFPFVVAIQTEERHISCGGSLLTPDWILTAAHCLVYVDDISMPVRSVHNYVLLMGTEDVRKYRESSTVQIRKPILFVPHSGFNHLYMENDIGLIKVDEEFELTEMVQTVTLPEERHDYEKDDLCTVIGWGYIKDPMKAGIVGYSQALVPTSLIMADVPVVELSVCQLMYASEFLHEGMNICAGYIEGGKDACQGDSGGPLIYNGSQIAIVSWGIGCAVPRNPGVYTRVDYFLDWIKITMIERQNYVGQGNSLRQLNMCYLFTLYLLIRL